MISFRFLFCALKDQEERETACTRRIEFKNFDNQRKSEEESESGVRLKQKSKEELFSGKESRRTEI